MLTLLVYCWRTKLGQRLVLSLLCLLLLLLSQQLWRISAAPTISATKRVTLQVDKNKNGQAERGDTLRYTVTVTNHSAVASTGVRFTDDLAANTTLVVTSLQTTPLAQDDSGYSTVGNVQLTVPVTQSLLLNDTDPDGTGGLTVSAFTPSAAGGAVNVAANGAFTYNPPPGFSGLDTFVYTADDGEGNTVTATVTITVGQVVWFVNNAASVPGDGRLTTPFSSIANLLASPAKAGDIIFIYQGAGNYSGALTLRNNQQLIGQGVGLTLAPNLTIPAAARPTIANVLLATDNTVRGLNINSSSGSALSGNSVGALTVNNVAITSSGTNGVTLRGGSAAMTVTFDSVTATGGTYGINLIDNRGRVTVNGGLIQNTTNHAIRLLNSVGPLDFTLRNSTIRTIPNGLHGLHLELTNSGALGTVTVQNNTFADIQGIGLRAIAGGSSSIGNLELSNNRFTANTNSIELLMNGQATLAFDLHDNPTISGDLTQVYLAANDAQPNDGQGPSITGHLRHNTIQLAPTRDGFGIWAVKSGDGQITVNVADNQIRGFGDSGIAVESLGGTGQVQATIVNNTATTTATLAVAGVYLRNGDGSSGETSRLCVNLNGNRLDSGSGTDYFLERENPATTTFQIQGLTPSPATPTQVATFVAATDAAPPVTTGVAQGNYFNAICTTVSAALAQLPWPAAVPVDAPLAARPPVRLQAWGAAFVTAVADLGAALHRFLVVPPAYAADQTVNLTLGTLTASQTVTLTFDVTIGSSFATPELCNQATVSADNVSDLATDDPTAGGSADPTCIAILLPDTTPPETLITQPPPAISTSATVTFTFSGTDNKTAAANLTFACQLDGGGFVPCTSPQSYSALADGLHTFQVRAVDEMGNVDLSPAAFTWNVNSVVLLPDLAVTKVNNVNGYALPGQPWTWTIRVTNQGDAAAPFAAGQPLLVDNLPLDNLTYGPPTIVERVGITGSDQLVCTLAEHDLRCAAVGGELALAPQQGTFTVQISAVTEQRGDYPNPRHDGQCLVDPDNRLTEVNEGNNTCDNSVSVGAPDLTLTKQHTGNFSLGQRDASYTISVQNVGSGPTTAAVTVTDQLPDGLTATAWTGSGWDCTLSPLGCTRSDSLAPGSTYPPLTLLVDVTGTTPETLINQATVTVAHDSDSANNVASDATAVVAVDTRLFLPLVTQK